MLNNDPRTCNDYRSADVFVRKKYRDELRTEMSDYPDYLSITDIYHYAPWELKDLIEEVIANEALYSFNHNGEKSVRKNDFIDWCACEMAKQKPQFAAY